MVHAEEMPPPPSSLPGHDHPAPVWEPAFTWTHAEPDKELDHPYPKNK